MRNAMIAAAAAFGLLGMQAAHADAVQRYQGGAMIQHMSSPQRSQPFAQGEGPRDSVTYGRQQAQAGGTREGETMYGRRWAQGEGSRDGTSYGRQQAQAEGPRDNTAYGRQQAQAEGPRDGTTYGRQQAAAEQTGVDNSAFRQA